MIELQDPKNKQFAICNDELLAVFGEYKVLIFLRSSSFLIQPSTDLFFVFVGVKRFRTFGMMKYLKNHFLD